jgi:acetyltransferase-like isoleucine patch superfamily enzyme
MIYNYINRIKLKVERIFYSFYYRILAITNFSFISFSTKIYCQKGSNFEIGKNVRIRGGGIITIAPGSTLKLDDYCWIGPGCIIYCKKLITIGKKTRIAHYTSILDHDYVINNEVDFYTYTSEKIIIGDSVWIGNSCIILKNTIINNHSIVGASSLLKSKIVPMNHIYFDKRESVLKVINDK